MKEEHKIVLNTMIMYIKMLLSLFITFYSTRIVLSSLGVTDFGIYNLVAGSISLLGFFNGSMSNTSQRFFAYEIGSNNFSRLKAAFDIAIFTHICCAFIITLILEIISPILFNNIFIINSDRIDAAQITFQIMIAITFINIVTTPFNADVYAHEDIYIAAIIDFSLSILRLIVALLLAFILRDKLIAYCLFLLGIEFISFIMKSGYCLKKYKECTNMRIFNLNKEIAKEIFPFLGWNIVESISWLAKGQGVAVMMNTIYGTIINAAYGVASQVNGQVLFFSKTLISAIVPQIHKAGGRGDFPKLLELAISSSKLGFLLLLLFINPLCFVVDFLFKLWLVNPPKYSSEMCVLLLCGALIAFLCEGVNIATQAEGSIKKYQMYSSLFVLASIPIGYTLYIISNNVYSFLYFLIVVEFLLVMLKYYIGSGVLKTTFLKLVKKIAIPCGLTTFISITISYLLNLLISPKFSLIMNAIFIITDIVILLPIIYYVGFDMKERQLTTNLLKSIKSKFNL